MKIRLFAVILVILLFISGCAEKECRTRDDCPSKGDCWISGCVKNSCDYRLKPGCTCGDGKCDKATENECTCEADCGKCSGSVGDIMEKTCINDKCITQLKGQEQKVIDDVITYEESRVVKLQMSLKLSFDSPFNVKKSLMGVVIKIDKILPEISDVKISKIKVIEHTGTKDRYGNWVDDQPQTLAENSYTKILYDESSLFSKEFPVYIEGLDPAASVSKNLVLEITYEFKSKDRYGNPVSGQSVFSKEFSLDLVSPDAPVDCPDCNDNNDCTQDICNAGTNFFCQHKIVSSGICCGDDVCSAGEDRCRCPSDCGRCEGDVGEYMGMACNSLNMCSFKVKNPNSVQPANKLAEFDLNGASISLKIAYDDPFDKSSSVFSFTFDPKVFTGIQNLVLKKVTVLDKSDNILGESSGSISLSPGAVSSASAAMDYKTLSAEESRVVSVKFDFSAELQDKSGSWNPAFPSYSYTVGDLTILNPG